MTKTRTRTEQECDYWSTFTPEFFISEKCTNISLFCSLHRALITLHNYFIFLFTSRTADLARIVTDFYKSSGRFFKLSLTVIPCFSEMDAAGISVLLGNNLGSAPWNLCWSTRSEGKNFDERTRKEKAGLQCRPKR